MACISVGVFFLLRFFTSLLRSQKWKKGTSKLLLRVWFAWRPIYMLKFVGFLFVITKPENWLDFQESVAAQHSLQISSLQAGSLGWVFESLLALVLYLTSVRASDYLLEY